MATFIKVDCGDCATAPCSCGWGGAGFLPTCGGDTTFDVTGYFNAAHDITVTLTGGKCFPLVGPHVCTDYGSDVKVYANTVLLFDSGCVTGDHVYTVTIPAGTTSLRCYSACECDFSCESGCGTTSEVVFRCA